MDKEILLNIKGKYFQECLKPIHIKLATHRLIYLENWLSLILTAKLTVSWSIEAVASSMISILVLRRNALAKQNSCRCPTLKFSPPSVTMESVNKVLLHKIPF